MSSDRPMRRPLNMREDGTVLLSTLLVLSLMSAVALALLTTLRTSVTRSGTLDAQAQVDLYAQGAREFTASQIESVAGEEPAALNARLAEPEPIILPFENGSITLVVTDGTHCFRLSALSDTSGLGSDTARLRFEALMRALGIDPGAAGRIAAASVDWVDADSQALPGGAEDGIYMSRPQPHRTANVPMVSVSELRAVDGMDEALFQRLLPHLCIGETGAPTQFNIETANSGHAPVLAAILGGGLDAERVALELIEQRPSGGYGSSETLLASPILQDFDNSAAQFDDIVFGPQRIVVEAIIRFGPVQRAQLLAYEGLDSRRPKLTYRAWGRGEFPSLAWARLTAEETEQ